MTSPYHPYLGRREHRYARVYGSPWQHHPSGVEVLMVRTLNLHVYKHYMKVDCGITILLPARPEILHTLIQRIIHSQLAQ